MKNWCLAASAVAVLALTSGCANRAPAQDTTMSPSPSAASSSASSAGGASTTRVASTGGTAGAGPVYTMHVGHPWSAHFEPPPKPKPTPVAAVAPAPAPAPVVMQPPPAPVVVPPPPEPRGIGGRAPRPSRG